MDFKHFVKKEQMKKYTITLKSMEKNIMNGFRITRRKTKIPAVLSHGYGGRLFNLSNT